MNDEQRELETAQEAQEAQEKERRINEFVAKLSRAKDKEYHLVEILDVKKSSATTVQWKHKGYTAWGGPARGRLVTSRRLGRLPGRFSSKWPTETGNANGKRETKTRLRFVLL